MIRFMQWNCGIGLAMAMVVASCGGNDDLVASTDTSTPDVNGPKMSCSSDDDCDAGVSCIGGVCVLDPVNEVRLTDNASDSEVSNTGLQLGCVGGVVDAPEGPATATLYGRVDRFGGGRKTIGIEVAVFEQDSWMSSPCLEESVENQNACFRELTSPWTDVSVDPEESEPTVPGTCEKHLECPAGYECVEIANGLSYGCEPQHGLFEIPNVPTNTWLVIRSRNTVPIYDKKWKDTQIYGVYLYADQVDADGRIKSNAMMVSDGQWITVPNTLLVPGGIRKNNGAVGGRIRDCRGGERSSFTVGNASMGLLEPGRATGYFNDDEQDTVPLLDSTGTDMYGRFTVVDVPPGLNRVAASVRLPDGSIESLGSEEFLLIPDSLAIVSFPGKQPILTK